MQCNAQGCTNESAHLIKIKMVRIVESGDDKTERETEHDVCEHHARHILAVVEAVAPDVSETAEYSVCDKCRKPCAHLSGNDLCPPCVKKWVKQYADLHKKTRR